MNDMIYRGPEHDARYIVPKFSERTSYGFREWDPYSKLFDERIIFLGVQIDDASANDVMAQLITLESMDPDRDTWFSAVEAKEYGLIDDIMTHANDVPGAGGTASDALQD